MKPKTNKDEIISEILKYELEITIAINSGYLPSDIDIYQEKRIRIIELRKLLKDE